MIKGAEREEELKENKEKIHSSSHNFIINKGKRETGTARRTRKEERGGRREGGEEGRKGTIAEDNVGRRNREQKREERAEDEEEDVGRIKERKDSAAQTMKGGRKGREED